MSRKNEWCNRRISSRQLGRVVFHDYFPMAGLVLPMYLARDVGGGGLLALLLGLLAGYGLLLVVCAQAQEFSEGYLVYLRRCFGKWLTLGIQWIYFLTALLAAAFGLELLGELAGSYLSIDTPVWLFLLAAALLAAYGLSLGMESRGRKYGVLFWLVVLPLTVVFLLALSSQKPGRWFQDAWMEEPVLAGAWQVFLFMQGVAVLPVYASAADSPQALVRAGKRGFLLAAAGNVLLYLLLTGVFGTATLGVMEHGALTLTALVKIPGGFLERQDALLCGIWLLSVYAFAENAMGIMSWCLGGWIGGADREHPLPEGHGALSAMAAFALALCICIFPSCRDILWQLYRRLAVPVLVAVPVAGGILMKWNMKWNSGRREGKS